MIFFYNLILMYALGTVVHKCDSQSFYSEPNVRVVGDQICICTNKPGYCGAPGLNEAPGLNAAPALNGAPGLNAAPALNGAPGLNAAPALNGALGSNETPEANGTPHNNRNLKIATKFRGFGVGSQRNLGRTLNADGDEDIKSRIIGGEKVSIEEAPYQVSIQLQGTHFCGGAIITNILVITASHCIIHKDPNLLNIRAGSSFHDQGGIVVYIAGYFLHPQYDPDTTDYDAAILKLVHPLKFSRFIQPIRLVSTYAWPPGTQAFVTGWGTLHENTEDIPEHLMGVILLTQSLQYCVQRYGRSFRITERMLCVGGPAGGGEDSCQGDSGGPLVIDNMLAGIVSWGMGCGKPRVPGLYTNVAAIRNFVQAVINY